ncbi:acyl-CoA N-acyltransferase [Auriculariales sp. MPI-PUGE-AT-0066]|nr:acyl-CoA N-acyltransferase [Auriculariales sp. MPI-PUGE-AT-0066]
MSNPNPTIIVRQAVPEDVKAILNIQVAAFTEAGIRRRYPGSIDNPEGFAEHSTIATFTVAADAATGEIAAMMQTYRIDHLTETPYKLLTEIPFAEQATVDSVNLATTMRRDFMGDRPHYYLYVLATHPDLQRRGAAGALLLNIISIADREQMPIYLESSSTALSLYKKNGFVENGKTVATVRAPGEPADGRFSTVAVREPRAS